MDLVDNASCEIIDVCCKSCEMSEMDRNDRNESQHVPQPRPLSSRRNSKSQLFGAVKLVRWSVILRDSVMLCRHMLSPDGTGLYW